jgi:hypothetical protein
MGVDLIHPPLAYALKSSPGATDLSIPTTSMSALWCDSVVVHAEAAARIAASSQAVSFRWLIP